MKKNYDCLRKRSLQRQRSHGPIGVFVLSLLFSFIQTSYGADFGNSGERFESRSHHGANLMQALRVSLDNLEVQLRRFQGVLVERHRNLLVSQPALQLSVPVAPFHPGSAGAVGSIPAFYNASAAHPVAPPSCCHHSCSHCSYGLDGEGNAWVEKMADRAAEKVWWRVERGMHRNREEITDHMLSLTAILKKDLDQVLAKPQIHVLDRSNHYDHSTRYDQSTHLVYHDRNQIDHSTHMDRSVHNDNDQIQETANNTTTVSGTGNTTATGATPHSAAGVNLRQGSSITKAPESGAGSQEETKK